MSMILILTYILMIKLITGVNTHCKNSSDIISKSYLSGKSFYKKKFSNKRIQPVMIVTTTFTRGEHISVESVRVSAHILIHMWCSSAFVSHVTPHIDGGYRFCCSCGEDGGSIQSLCLVLDQRRDSVRDRWPCTAWVSTHIDFVDIIAEVMVRVVRLRVKVRVGLGWSGYHSRGDYWSSDERGCVDVGSTWWVT